VDGRDLAPAAEQPEPTVDTNEFATRADVAAKVVERDSMVEQGKRGRGAG
jgi:hypothetical protein